MQKLEEKVFLQKKSIYIMQKLEEKGKKRI